jgi:uncharacterized protein YajQ (UPF0234 family)
MSEYTNQAVTEMLMKAVEQTKRDCIKETAIIAVNAMAMAGAEYRDTAYLFDGVDSDTAKQIALQAVKDNPSNACVSRYFAGYVQTKHTETALSCLQSR